MSARRPQLAGRALALAVAVLAGGCVLKESSSEPSGSQEPPGTGSGAGMSAFTGTGTGSAGSSTSGTAGSVGGVPTGGGAGQGIITGAAGQSSGGAGTTGAAGSIGTGIAGAGGGGFAGAGAVDAGSCVVTITPLIPGSFVDLEAGTTSILRLQASVSGYAGDPDGGAPRWLWSVKMSGGSSLADLTWTPVDDSTIDVPLGQAGTYQVQASIAGAPSCDRAPIIFTVQPPATPSFRFRVTPPGDAQLPIRELFVKSTDLGGGHTVDLGDAKSSEVVSLSPVDERGFPIPSYVRITSPSFAFDLEGYTGRGALIAPLATGLTYDVLILPDGGLAPLLVSGLPDAVSNKMAITQGATVTGIMHDGNGNVVVGARVILQYGARPSTIGESGADGRFTLTTREGALAADILPPDGSGLPEAQVTASPGIVLLVGMTRLDLSMDWAKVPAAALTIKVSGAGPGAPAFAGARVRADLAAPLSNVGTLRVNGASAAALPATGTAHADGVTDAQGVAQLGLLPTGTYHVIVAPPDGAPSVAITLVDVALPAAGATASVSLAPPVTLSGLLTPAGATAGAKVTAIDRGLLAAATLPAATAGADGAYTLALAAGRSYELLVEPNPALGLARSVVDLVTPVPGANARTNVVPPIAAWGGSITGAGRAVAGALVQVYCAAPAAACFDSTLAVAQGLTAADGTITLALPGPTGP